MKQKRKGEVSSETMLWVLGVFIVFVILFVLFWPEQALSKVKDAALSFGFGLLPEEKKPEFKGESEISEEKRAAYFYNTGEYYVTSSDIDKFNPNWTKDDKLLKKNSVYIYFDREIDPVFLTSAHFSLYYTYEGRKQGGNPLGEKLGEGQMPYGPFWEARYNNFGSNQWFLECDKECTKTIKENENLKSGFKLINLKPNRYYMLVYPQPLVNSLIEEGHDSIQFKTAKTITG